MSACRQSLIASSRRRYRATSPSLRSYSSKWACAFVSASCTPCRVMPASAASSDDDGGGSSGVLIAIIAAAVLALIAFLVLRSRRRRDEPLEVKEEELEVEEKPEEKPDGEK